MERFKKFIGKEINLEKIKELDESRKYGIKCNYLPDPPEEFDEFEFVTGDDIMIMVTVEHNKVQRVFLGKVDEDEPDIPKNLPEEELNEYLSQKGDQLVEFFEDITR